MVGASALLPPMPALAGDASPCIAAAGANERATSYRAVLSMGTTGTSTTDIQRPDRIHLTTPGMEVIAIGHKAWRRSGSGWQPFAAMPVAEILSMSKTELNSKKLASCVDAGMGLWHGQPAHIFRGTSIVDGKPSETTIYVFSDGYVHHIENKNINGGFSGDFSNFNSTVVNPPV
jgi:hypothetical protein